MNVAVTVALLPVLVGGWGSGRDDATRVVAAQPAAAAETTTTSTTSTTVAPTTTTVAPTTTTVAPPTTTSAPVARPTTNTTARRAAAAAPAPTTTTAAPATTTTTAAPLPPTPVEPPQDGKATYYVGGAPGTCAHRTLPFGTSLTVTAAASGASVRCTVADRGPFVAGYVVDLDVAEFEQLAPRSAGVVVVRLTW